MTKQEQEQQAQGPTNLPASSWKDVAMATWKEAGDDNVGIIAAGVAFYAFLAFVPLLTAFVLSYGLVAEPATVVSHVQGLTRVMPQDAAGIIGEQLQSMTDNAGGQTGFALALAIAVAIYGASKGAGSIMTALNVAYDVEESRGFVARTALSLTMTVGAVLVLVLAILAVAARDLVGRLLPAWGGASQFLLQAAFFALAAAAVALLLALIYRYGPNRTDAQWRWITPGSAIATLVWLVATLGFGFYVSNFGNYNATYGSLGAVIVFLTWLYLSAYIVLLGAELNAELENKVGTHKTADDPDAARSHRSQAPATSERRPDASPPASLPPPAPAVIARLAAFALLRRLLGNSYRDRRRT